ncbi:tetratricopeptide repeat protein [Chryseobacterium sp. KACC 21268]|nr:tetratricopeptide repeat protein [Chryseobacterium sp. KACC 21268]
MQKIGFFLLLFLGFSQNYFSINKPAQDKDEIQKLIDQSKRFLEQRNKPNALISVNKAINLSKTKKNTDQQILALNQKGKVHMAFREFGEAVKVFESAIKLPSSNKNCEIFNNLGVCKFNLGKGYESIQACLQAKKCYEESKEVAKVNSTLYMLGWSHAYVGEYDKASQYFLKQLEILKKDTAQVLNKGKVYRGLGINASMKGDFKSSINYLNQALNISNSKKDIVGTFENLSALSSSYAQMNDFDNAFKYSEKGLIEANKINDEAVILEAKMNAITALVGLKKFDKASTFITEIAKDTAKYYFVPTFKVQYYQNNSLIQEGLGNYKDALYSQKRLKQYNDSIISVNNTIGISQLKDQYNFEKDQNTILAQKTELGKQAIKLKNNTILTIIISSVGIICLVIFAFSIYLKREKRKRLDLLSLKFKDGFNEYLKNKYDLTQQQLELWLKIVEGVEEVQIAVSFFKSAETINRWRRQLYAKLNSVEETEKHYTKPKAIILYNKEVDLFKELSNR